MNHGDLPNQSTFSWGERHAKVFLLPVEGQDSTTQEVSSCIRMWESLNISNPQPAFGKMFQVSLVQTEAETLVPSSGKWNSWGMGGRIASSMLNGAEAVGSQEPFRNDEGVCSLFSVLETNAVHPKYYLSAKACNGILSRAARRGKTLPPLLQQALSQAQYKISAQLSQANGQSNQVDHQDLKQGT